MSGVGGTNLLPVLGKGRIAVIAKIKDRAEHKFVIGDVLYVDKLEANLFSIGAVTGK